MRSHLDTIHWRCTYMPSVSFAVVLPINRIHMLPEEQICSVLALVLMGQSRSWSLEGICTHYSAGWSPAKLSLRKKDRSSIASGAHGNRLSKSEKPAGPFWPKRSGKRGGRSRDQLGQTDASKPLSGLILLTCELKALSPSEFRLFLLSNSACTRSTDHECTYTTTAPLLTQQLSWLKAVIDPAQKGLLD